MYVIEALHPEGWRRQGRSEIEYWAYQEAQVRCCSDGRHYRIRKEDSGQIVALVNPSSCRVATPWLTTARVAGLASAPYPPLGTDRADP